MEKIKFGIIGTSTITENFLKAALLNENFELVAIYSRDLDKAKTFGNKFPFKLFFDDFDQFVKCDKFEAVYIASPNFLHKSQSIACLENKKHVLCEKALAGNKKEVLAMIKSSKQNNKVLMEAMRPTCLPNFLKVKMALKEIGTIRNVSFTYCQYSSRYDKFKDGVVLNAFKPEMATGALSDIGIYCLHPIINLFGKPTEIYGIGHILHTGTDGSGTCLLKYKEMNATITYSKIANSYMPCEIQGEQASILIDSTNFRHVEIKYKDGTTKDLTLPQETNDMCYELEEFITTILNKKEESSLNPLENSLLTIECIDKIRKTLGVVYPCDQY